MPYRKSELALKYAFRLRRYSAETSVLWLPADSIETFHQAYLALARSCWISGHEDPAADVGELVKHWLEQDENDKWLMVIDNAGNDDNDISPSGENGFMNSGLLSRYIPNCGHGYVLVTTRSASVGKNFAQGELIEVETMTMEESCALIQARLPHEDNKSDVTALAELHKMMPLALVQATDEITRKSLGLKDYIRSFFTKDIADGNRVKDAAYNSRLCISGTGFEILRQGHAAATAAACAEEHLSVTPAAEVATTRTVDEHIMSVR
jgi:hypothetical protein